MPDEAPCQRVLDTKQVPLVQPSAGVGGLELNPHNCSVMKYPAALTRIRPWRWLIWPAHEHRGKDSPLGSIVIRVGLVTRSQTVVCRSHGCNYLGS